MHDGVDCRRLRARFEAYLTLHPEDEEAREIRAHLAACPDCRAELGRYFILERWEEGEAFSVRAAAGLAQSIIGSLEERGVTPPPSRTAKRSEGARPGRGLFWNYLAAALATLLLAFGNCFDAVTGLAVRTGRLQEGIRAIDRYTQRIIESSFEDPGGWWRPFESESDERR